MQVTELIDINENGGVLGYDDCVIGFWNLWIWRLCDWVLESSVLTIVWLNNTDVIQLIKSICWFLFDKWNQILKIKEMNEADKWQS